MMTCRSCKSTRLQKGYKQPALLLRLLFIRSFLCDHCNRQFFAFSLWAPQTHNRRLRSVAETIQESPPVDLSRLNEAAAALQTPGPDKTSKLFQTQPGFKEPLPPDSEAGIVIKKEFLP